MSNQHIQRLESDYQKLKKLADRSLYIDILQVEGDPPTKYIIKLICLGIEKLNRDDQPVFRLDHQVEIILDENYPTQKPNLKWLTPIFHPNISSSGDIYMWEWSNGKLYLDDVVKYLARIARYEEEEAAHNIKACDWAQKNRHFFPTDKRLLFSSSDEHTTPDTLGERSARPGNSQEPEMNNIRIIEQSDQASQIRVLSKRSQHPTLPDSPFEFPNGHVVWGQPDKAHVLVSLSQDAYEEIRDHAKSDTRHEVGGLLLGQAYQAGNVYHVAVVAALPDHLGHRSAATFTFTYESWIVLVKKAEKEFPDQRIVGWYHSHPNYGIFYSSTDKRSQRIYFNSPWRIGLVVDPIRDEGGFFALPPDDGQAAPLPGFFERLDREGKSIISWRNWSSPTSKVKSNILQIQKKREGHRTEARNSKFQNLFSWDWRIALIGVNAIVLALLFLWLICISLSLRTLN